VRRVVRHVAPLYDHTCARPPFRDRVVTPNPVHRAEFPDPEEAREPPLSPRAPAPALAPENGCRADASTLASRPRDDPVVPRTKPSDDDPLLGQVIGSEGELDVH